MAEETGNDVPEVCIRFANIDRLTSLALSAAPGRATVAPLTRGYLVHELVHAQQFAARKHQRVSCLGSLEGDAYNAQALYLSTRGLREDAFLLQVLGILQSACEYTY